MQSAFRLFFATVVALGCVVAVSTFWAVASAMPLLAAHTTALIMGGTFHPLIGPKDNPDFVTAYLDSAVLRHLEPAFIGPVTNAVAVFTPEEFFPIGRLTLDDSVAEGRVNLHRCLAAGTDCVFNDDDAVVPGVGPSAAPQVGDALMVFGYSQSAMIASLAKQDLISDHQPGDPAVPFMLVANPMRPNGGVLLRGLGLPTIPILGISFIGASPTDSEVLSDGTYVYPTVDIARQYDGFGGDFPVRPLNLVALVNALLGYQLLHGETVEVPFDQARYQGRAGDTSYYLIETGIVPILQPLVPFVPQPILKALDAPLRVIIEDAYDRATGPGTPTPLSWWPANDVFGTAWNLIRSIPVALDNFLEGFGLARVLGTEAPGTFGVGGPDLPDQPGAAAGAAVVGGSEEVAASDHGRAEYSEPCRETAEPPDVGEDHDPAARAGGKRAEPADVAIAPDGAPPPDGTQPPDGVEARDGVEASDATDVTDATDITDVSDVTVEMPEPTELSVDPEIPGADPSDSEDLAHPEPDTGTQTSQPGADVAGGADADAA